MDCSPHSDGRCHRLTSCAAHAARRPEQHDIALKLLSEGDERHSFGQQLAQLLHVAGALPLPIEVTWRKLTVETDAMVGSSGNPTVANAFVHRARALMGHRVPTEPLLVLDGVSGRLRPGSMTLLLGEPEAGQSGSAIAAATLSHCEQLRQAHARPCILDHAPRRPARVRQDRAAQGAQRAPAPQPPPAH